MPTCVTKTHSASTATADTVFYTGFASDGNAHLAYPGVVASGSDFYGAKTVWTTTLSGGLLAVASTQLQSYRGLVPGLRNVNVFSFNFADLLPGQVQKDAYMGQCRCASSPLRADCQTIFQDRYAPNLVSSSQQTRSWLCLFSRANSRHRSTHPNFAISILTSNLALLTTTGYLTRPPL